jgi:hypothetical protein
MSIPPALIYALQAALLLAGMFLLWSAFEIRTHHNFELMKNVSGRKLEAPQLIEREFAQYQFAFALALFATVFAWFAMDLSFATATIVTTFVAVVATGWRGTLTRLHDVRYGAQSGGQ